MSVNITIRISQHGHESPIPIEPELVQQIGEPRLERSKEITQLAVDKLLSGQRVVILKTLGASKKMIKRLLKEGLPQLAKTIIKIVPGLLAILAI